MFDEDEENDDAMDVVDLSPLKLYLPSSLLLNLSVFLSVPLYVPVPLPVPTSDFLDADDDTEYLLEDVTSLTGEIAHDVVVLCLCGAFEGVLYVVLYVFGLFLVVVLLYMFVLSLLVVLFLLFLVDLAGL